MELFFYGTNLVTLSELIFAVYKLLEESIVIDIGLIPVEPTIEDAPNGVILLTLFTAKFVV